LRCLPASTKLSAKRRPVEGRRFHLCQSRPSLFKCLVVICATLEAHLSRLLYKAALPVSWFSAFLSIQTTQGNAHAFARAGEMFAF